MRVMIVEDEALIAMHLEMIVVSLGHEVCAVAATAPEAVARAIECSPDVALMGIRLAKGGSGLKQPATYTRFAEFVASFSAQISTRRRDFTRPCGD